MRSLGAEENKRATVVQRAFFVMLGAAIMHVDCHQNYAVTITLVKEVQKCRFQTFRRKLDENCVRLGYYAACGGNSLSTFRYKLSAVFREIAAACCLISGFHREVDRKCALLSYYTAYSGNFLPTFEDKLSAVFREVAAACCLISVFRREVDRKCSLLSCYCYDV